MMARLGELESQMQAMEATLVPSVLKGLVLHIHTSLKTEAFPAIRDLWNLYKLATEGRVKVVLWGLEASQEIHFLTG
jgi:hypothetical protein